MTELHEVCLSVSRICRNSLINQITPFSDTIKCWCSTGSCWMLVAAKIIIGCLWQQRLSLDAGDSKGYHWMLVTAKVIIGCWWQQRLSLGAGDSKGYHWVQVAAKVIIGCRWQQRLSMNAGAKCIFHLNCSWWKKLFTYCICRTKGMLYMR